MIIRQTFHFKCKKIKCNATPFLFVKFKVCPCLIYRFLKYILWNYWYNHFEERENKVIKSFIVTNQFYNNIDKELYSHSWNYRMHKLCHRWTLLVQARSWIPKNCYKWKYYNSCIVLSAKSEHISQSPMIV